MSTTAMWLLLAVVVIVIVFASVLYKRTFTVHELALTGVMAALSLVAYLFFRVPFYGGSSFHLGNTFTALTALLLDGVSGGLAGAIGLALADILAGDPGYAVTTFILKFIIGITCGAVAHDRLAVGGRGRLLVAAACSQRTQQGDGARDGARLQCSSSSHCLSFEIMILDAPATSVRWTHLG